MDEYCAITGRRIESLSDAIYDDGEWLSWEGIEGCIEETKLRKAFPQANAHLVQILNELIGTAEAYKAATGRYLQIWGELGELFGEAYWGIQLHPPHTAGSDGRLGNDWIEIKTISPEKTGDRVYVKRAGNFNKLLIVKISEDFEFEARMIDRAALGKGNGKLANVVWKRGEEATATTPEADEEEPHS